MIHHPQISCALSSSITTTSARTTSSSSIRICSSRAVSNPPLGTSTCRHLGVPSRPGGLFSVPNPASRTPIITELVQLYIQMPLVVAIVPPAFPVIPSAPFHDAPGTSDTFPQTQQTERNFVVTLAEFEFLMVFVRMVLREISALDSALQPLISGRKKTTRPREIFQRVVVPTSFFTCRGRRSPSAPRLRGTSAWL